MSTEELGSWYHCGHCGSVFRSSFGHDEDRVCDSCHLKPGTGVWPTVSTKPPASPTKVAGFNRQAEKVVKIKKAEPARTAKPKRIYWVMLIWLVILLSAAGLRYYFSDSNANRHSSVSDSHSSRYVLKEKENLLREALPLCDQLLRSFIASNTAEEMGSGILKKDNFADQIGLFIASQKLVQLDPNSITRTQQDFIQLGREWVIWTQWKDTSGEIQFDAVFRKDGDKWKLDWPAFSRFHPVSWTDFHAGKGPERSEFKLLARLLREDETSRSDSDFMQVLMVEPVWGKPNEISQAQSVFMVDWMSKEAQSLSAAFEVRKKDRILYNAKITPMEPEEWIRLSVVISRDELDGKFRFNLDEIKACHWVDSGASGFDPDRLKVNKF